MLTRPHADSGSDFELHGVLTAAVTPVTPDMNIDIPCLGRHCRRLLDQGCHAIALMGSTGEASSFSTSERKSALEGLLENGFPPDRILLGTGSCSLTDTLDLTRHAIGHGVVNCMIIPPFYYKKVREKGIYLFFSKLIESVNNDRLRIFYYHIPKASGIPFSIPMIENLITHYSGIMHGIKDASGDLDFNLDLCRHFTELRVFTGPDIYLLDNLKAGGAGCISATTNITASLVREIYDNRRSEGTEALIKQLLSIRGAVQKFPFIAATKAILGKITGESSWQNFRPPWTSLSEKEKVELFDRLEQIGFSL